jgi:predicted DsbA family dithiol-disulfide isomerase
MGVDSAGAADELVVYTDYVCAWCYLLEPALARLRDDGLAMDYRGIELRPAPRHLPAPGVATAEWNARIRPAAEALGVAMREPALVPRTRKAHELAAHARAMGLFHAVHDALFQAYWVDGADIGRIDVLVEIAAAAGLDADGAHRALGLDQHVDEVARHAREAREHRIVELPTIRRGAQLVTGVQRYDRLLDWIRNGAAPAPGGSEQG